MANRNYVADGKAPGPVGSEAEKRARSVARGRSGSSATTLDPIKLELGLILVASVVLALLPWDSAWALVGLALLGGIAAARIVFRVRRVLSASGGADRGAE